MLEEGNGVSMFNILTGAQSDTSGKGKRSKQRNGETSY